MLRAVLKDNRERAELFKRLATCVVRRDILPAGAAAVDSLAWKGPAPDFGEICARLEAPVLVRRAEDLASRRTSSD
jgi:hypothetical protein